MAVKEQIELILAERARKAEKLIKDKETLVKIQDYLKEMRVFKNNALNGDIDQSLLGNNVEKIKNIDTISIEKKIDVLKGRINDAIKRFERDHIAIATVGKARQGKSTFLQSVGNLHNDIIPAYDTSDCTGATSLICNDPTMEEGRVSVKIVFKEQEDLMKIVREYLEIIRPGYTKDNHIDFEDVKYIDIMTLESYIRDGEAEKSVALKHLKKIVNNFETISVLFGRGSMYSSNPEEIKKYVAQSNGKNINDPDVEYYYNYLAVARAEISCKFYNDCGRIVLVDTVGLGDTQAGIDEAMLNTVDKECDAAIVVTKPISAAHNDDLDIYKHLREHFGNRNMEQWLFYIANLHRGNNDNAVDDFEASIRNGNYNICDCRKIDCSNREEVNKNFMMPLLEKLTANMDDIDRAYLRELNAQIEEMISSCMALIEAMPAIKTIDPGQEAGQMAYEAGQKTYRKMTAQLKAQVLYWKKEKDRPNSALWNKVQQILVGLDNLAPKAESLQNIIDSNGDMSPNGLWEAACNYVRNEVTDRFNAIDAIMEKETKNFKNTLVKHMYVALQNIIDPDGNESVDENVDMIAWLKNVMDNVIGNQEDYRQIAKAVTFLNQFEFSIKENVIQEVRKQLYTLNPIADGYYAPMYNFSPTNSGEEVHYYLTSRLAVIEDELRHAMFSLYRKPNQTFYAAAEEFYDRLTFAIDLKSENESEFRDMNQVWGKFFMQYNDKLWKENAEKYEKVNTLINKYNMMRTLLKDELANI